MSRGASNRSGRGRSLPGTCCFVALLAVGALALQPAWAQESQSVAGAAAPAATGAAAAGATPAAGATAAETPPQPEFKRYHLWEEPAGIALIIYSIVGLSLIIERLLAWQKVRSSTRDISSRTKDLLARPNRDDLLKAYEKSASPLGEVMAFVLKRRITDSPETTQLLLENGLSGVGRRLKRNLSLLACVAGTAPFMGLFGTVLGIMNTFNSIAEKGFGGPAVISQGIGQALITTAGGLAVAIPTFIAYNLFIAKANNKLSELREQASSIFVALGDM